MRFRLTYGDARVRARREFQAYPIETYLTEIKSWRDAPGGFVAFIMKRLRNNPDDQEDEAGL